MDVAEEEGYLFELSSDLDSTADDDFQIETKHLLAIWLLLPEQRACNLQELKQQYPKCGIMVIILSHPELGIPFVRHLWLLITLRRGFSGDDWREGIH